jgi:hypothetical protein
VNASTTDGKIFGRPELRAQIDDDRRHHGEQIGDRPGDEGADRGGCARAGPARPRLAIWLPSSAVTMVADSPGV